MSRGKKRKQDQEQVGLGLVGGDAVVQPATPSAADEMDDPQTMIAKAVGMPVEKLGDYAAQQQLASSLNLANQVKEYAQRVKSEQEAEFVKKWTSMSCQERTQQTVDKNWGKNPDTPRYRVRVVQGQGVRGKPESITLDIPANSPEEAQGRYLSVCGIRSTDHHVKVTPLSAKKPKLVTVGGGDDDADDEDYIPEERIPEGAFVEAD